MCRRARVSTTPVPKSKTRPLASLGVNALRLGDERYPLGSSSRRGRRRPAGALWRQTRSGPDERIGRRTGAGKVLRRRPALGAVSYLFKRATT
jgi:hypothetical protein